MLIKPGSSLVMIALYGGFFQGAVHPLYLAVRPGVSRLGQPMLYTILGADPVETMPTGQQLVRLGCELHSVISQQLMHLIGLLIQHPTQEAGC